MTGCDQEDSLKGRAGKKVNLYHALLFFVLSLSLHINYLKLGVNKCIYTSAECLCVFEIVFFSHSRK